MTSPAFESEILTSELPEAVFLEDLDGNILDVNDGACDLLGYEREELLELTVDDLVPEGEPAFLPGQIDEATQAGEPLETVNIDKEGNEIPVELRGKLIEMEGNERILVTVRDISERKRAERKLRKSEERLELALEGTEAGIWNWKVQTGDVVFSERWAGIIGYTLEELQPVTIETWNELVHTEDQKRSEELLEKHFNGETEVYECEARMKHKNGDWVWILDRGKVVEWNEEGDPTRMVGTHQEITERKKAEQALSKERNKLKHLHDAVDRFQQCETEDELCNVAVRVTQRVLDFDLCTFYCVEGDELVPVASTESMELEDLPNHNLDEGLAGESFQKKQSILGDDLRREEKAVTDRRKIRGYMSIPIGDVGVFQAGSKELGAFDEHDLELGEILAGHLHEEIKRIRLEEDLREQAIRDPLTDLYNRRYFNETLKKEAQKAERYERPVAFLMLDVNRFKEINDRYSHQRGDEVLKEVAGLLKENVREADTVVRYGGDEFLVMMPETNGGVTNTVERIKDELNRLNERTDLLDFPVTLAIGVSHWSPDQERDVEEALKEADREMYEDKRDNG